MQANIVKSKLPLLFRPRWSNTNIKNSSIFRGRGPRDRLVVYRKEKLFARERATHPSTGRVRRCLASLLLRKRRH
jgi:hypothetical protein